MRALKNRKDIINFIINRSELYREPDLRMMSAERLRELYQFYTQGGNDLPKEKKC